MENEEREQLRADLRRGGGAVRRRTARLSGRGAPRAHRACADPGGGRLLEIGPVDGQEATVAPRRAGASRSRGSSSVPSSPRSPGGSWPRSPAAEIVVVARLREVGAGASGLRRDQSSLHRIQLDRGRAALHEDRAPASPGWSARRRLGTARTLPAEQTTTSGSRCRRTTTRSCRIPTMVRRRRRRTSATGASSRVERPLRERRDPPSPLDDRVHRRRVHRRARDVLDHTPRATGVAAGRALRTHPRPRGAARGTIAKTYLSILTVAHRPA